MPLFQQVRPAPPRPKRQSGGAGRDGGVAPSSFMTPFPMLRLLIYLGVRQDALTNRSRWPAKMSCNKAGALIGLAVLALAALMPAAPFAADKDKERPTPSGLPVPRWVVLKFEVVNARSAPGDDSRLLWVYRAKGLPVQVVAETNEWRRICGLPSICPPRNYNRVMSPTRCATRWQHQAWRPTGWNWR